MNKLKNYPELFYQFDTQDVTNTIDPTEQMYAEKNQIYYIKGDEKGLL